MSRYQKGVPSQFLQFCLVQSTSKEHLLANDAGGSRAAITKGHLEAFPLVLPTDRILTAFEQITDPLFGHIFRNAAESRTLAQIRNLLLPKVMSGKLRIKEAEKAVGELV